MIKHTEEVGNTDRELAHHFAQMRREDGTRLPVFPGADTLSGRNRAGPPGHRYGAAWKIAGMVAAITAIALLVIRQDPQDPGVLYADIMSISSIATDQLLDVSPGTLPEITDLPGFYEVDMPLERAQYTN